MRIEQIIATVARTLVVTNVREIRGVVAFVNASRLHLWQMRMQGMSCYLRSLFSGDLSLSFDINDFDHQARCLSHGSKRGIKPGQLMLAPVNCQWKNATA